jgi:molybdopterin-guanine dinucleotide biosynthesis protein A
MAEPGGLSQSSAVVLAGGSSSRLGQDKAFLSLEGLSLIERIIETLSQLSDEVIIVTNEVDKYEQFEALVVSDVYPGKGALGGIYSGLKAATRSYSLVVACDMPFLNLSLLRYMQGLVSGYDVVIPRTGKLTEALHAFYSRNCLPLIQQQLLADDLRITHFFPRVRVRYVDRQEIEVFDPQHLSFFNINSQADLEKARRELHQGHGAGPGTSCTEGSHPPRTHP